MALITIPANPIWVDVADRTASESGDFVIKQRALYQRHVFQEDALGNCSLVVEVLVYAFAATPDGGYGQPLNALGIMPRREHLRAGNDTLVENATGKVLCTFTTPQTPADIEAAAAKYEQDVVLQGQYFQRLRDQGFPGTERQLIELYIRLANAVGKFA